MSDKLNKTYDLLNIVYDPKSLEIITTDALKAITDKKEVLKVTANLTHAGRVTGNGGLYLPYMMGRSIPYWTKPFARPILVNHDRYRDPIGRAISARFVKTPPKNVSDDILKAAYNMKRLDREDQWWWIDKLYNTMLNPKFEGLGYTELTYYVSDAQAVQKVLDGRYLTLSVGYGSDALYCSICKAPMHSGDCNHWIGDLDDDTGKPVFGVYGMLYPREGSYVNVPADDYAQHTEFEFMPTDCEGNSVCSLGDTSAFTTHFSQMIEDAKVVLIRDDSVKNFYMNSNGGTMNLTMKKLLEDSWGNYQELAKFLPEGAKALTEDELKELSDDSFAGPNRTFPVIDAAHVEAIDKMLKKVNDSAAKREFVEVFDAIKQDLAKKAEAEDAKRALLDAAIFDDFTAEELKAIYDNVQKAAKARGIIEDEEHESEDDLKSALEIVKQRNKQLEISLQVAQDSLQSMVTEMVDQYAQMVIDLKKIAGLEIKDETAYEAELKKRSVGSLRDLYKDIRDSVADKLKGNNTVEQEDNPTQSHVNGEVNDKKNGKMTKEEIMDQYRFLLNHYGVKQAQDYLDLKIASGEYKPDGEQEDKDKK